MKSPKENLEVRIAELEKELSAPIRGALKSCYDAHGKIDIPSAEKRLIGAVSSFYRLHLPKLIESVLGDIIPKEKIIGMANLDGMSGDGMRGYNQCLSELKSNLKMFIE